MMRNIAPKLYQRARDSLAADIANGAIPTTKRLTESWVAELFGISRVPARQALAELEQRGLIRKAEGRGYAIAEEAANRSRQRARFAVGPGGRASSEYAPAATASRFDILDGHPGSRAGRTDGRGEIGRKSYGESVQ